MFGGEIERGNQGGCLFLGFHNLLAQTMPSMAGASASSPWDWCSLFGLGLFITCRFSLLLGRSRRMDLLLLLPLVERRYCSQ